MSKPSPPPPPNPYAVANAQTGTNIGTAIASQTLADTNQVTPYGTTTYDRTGGYTDPSTGQWVPQYTQTTALNPTEQQIFSGTENAGATLVPTAQSLAEAVGGSIGTPLNVNQTANNGIIAGGPQALDQNATNAIYQGELGLLQPQWQQQQKDLQDQLARQGISVGNDAYSNAENQLQTTQNAANLGALGQATGQGITAANNMFNLALQGQNQNLGQQNMVATTPLTRLSQIYGGASPAMPAQPGMA